MEKIIFFLSLFVSFSIEINTIDKPVEIELIPLVEASQTKESISKFNFTSHNVIIYNANLTTMTLNILDKYLSFFPSTIAYGSWVLNSALPPIPNGDIPNEKVERFGTSYYKMITQINNMTHYTIKDKNQLEFSLIINYATGNEYHYSRYKFDGVLGLNTVYKKDKDKTDNETFVYSIFSNSNFTRNIVILNYMTGIFTIGYNSDVPIEKYKVCKTKKETSLFSCQMDYMIFGTEIDIYLATSFRDITLIFDNLLYYSFLPINLLDYFINEFFNSKDGCTSVSLGNDELYYIKCSKKKISIYTHKRPINFIIGGFSYEYSGLFSEDFLFTDINEYKVEKEDDDIFFNILFRGNNTQEWIIGINFFKDKAIGYDYDTDSVLLYYEKKIDMTKYNVSREGWSDDQIASSWMFISTSAVLVVFLLVIFIVHSRSKRTINKEILEMLK